ncbi:MAG TPA: phosphatidylinositol mannoside acyltransferase [Acidimicrobiales bacterium]|nr:phosphatidylinositol mannoside acyltransferase [Acidimicrobiales bacterium]
MAAELRRRAPLLGYRGGARLARLLPEPVAEAAAAAAGRAAARLLSRRRALVERHMRRAGAGHVRAADVFASYARYWLESFRLPDRTPAELDARMRTEGLDHLRAAVDAGNGAILALPHLGGWDFGGAWFGSHGWKATVVAEPLEPPELFDWFARFRERFGLTVVPLGPEAGTAVLNTLKAGGIVGLVCDRDLQGTGVEVEFFGERTTLPSGPATLALRTGAALLPTAVYFEGRRGHCGVVRPPIACERSGSFREDVVRITQALTHELEALIRAAPEQWHLLQPNWPADRA